MMIDTVGIEAWRSLELGGQVRSVCVEVQFLSPGRGRG